MAEGPLFQFIFEDAAEPRPLSVSELNAEIKGLLERRFASVWVEGEVVDFRQAGSGHWYFNLNDGTSQIKCVAWRGTNYRIRFRPNNGIKIRIRGRLSFWDTKGELKLSVDSLEPAGEGALRAAFEQIKATLDGEGLFSAELKRPIPFFPRRIGLVTSRSGAALHDILTVLDRRAKSVSVVLASAVVQGEGAADSIRNATLALNRYNKLAAQKIDVIIIGRGGGSAEDLWAFNDERLARTIRASEIPIISAVGHEIDWTIADLVADLRAATPSAAAEIVAAREEDILNSLVSGEVRLIRLLERRLFEARTRVDDASSCLKEEAAYRVQMARQRYATAAVGLSPATVKARTSAIANRIELLDGRRVNAVRTDIQHRSEQLNVEMAKLNALSPLAVLTRGYSVTQTASGAVVRDASEIQPGDKLNIRLHRGKLDAQVLASE